MRKGIRNGCLPLLCAVALHAQQPAQPLTVAQKLRVYAISAYGPRPAGLAAASAGIHQWLDSPEEWGQGMAGFGRRFGSRYAQNAIEETVRLGVVLARREDPRYFSSTQTRISRRIWHAVRYTFLTRMDNGKESVAVGRLSGALAGGFLSRRWQPESTRGAGMAFRTAGYSIAADAGGNLFREFWPDIRRRIFHRR